MQLVIDAGNTNTVFAVFHNKKICGQWRLSTEHSRTGDEYFSFIKDMLSLANINPSQITDAIISNVVPQQAFSLNYLCQHYFNVSPIIIGDKNVELGITIAIDNPKQVGADRLVNAVAGCNRYHTHLIIIDFGTATTFDVVSVNREYLGGVIAPGIHLSVEALHQGAAKLPEIDISKPDHIIGNSTEEAMRSGIYWGYSCMIEGMIAKIKDELGDVNVTTLATGGLAELFKPSCPSIQCVENDLTVQGLHDIYLLNESK